jgi:RNA polymerase sigma factor (sigma-70 family)
MEWSLATLAAGAEETPMVENAKPEQAAFDESVCASRIQALSELALHRRDQLFRFIFRRLQDAAEAEEITQQTFLAAIEGISQFRSDSQLNTWLYGIAANLIANHLTRSPRRRFRWESEDVLEADSNYSTTPEDSIELQDLLQRVRQHISDLPETLKVTMSLVAVEGLSYSEVAAQLKIPVGTVRSRISRSRAILLRRLEEEGVSCY